MSEPGTLYVIGVPIGNYKDVSQRALEVFSHVDLIACEDTRTAQQLLRSYGITKQTVSYYDQVEREKAPRLLNCLQEGKSIALISEAGTPGISDPGYVLVRQARQAGVPVIPIPGPSAVVAALSVSGIPSHTFLFTGFMPKKESQLTEQLQEYRGRTETIVFYESPKRITKTLQTIRDVLGDRRLFLTREMTKTYEEYLSGTVTEVLRQLKEPVRGEITCVLEGSGEEEEVSPQHRALLRKMIDAGLSARDAIQIAAEALGLQKNALKRLLHDHRENQ